MRRLSRKPAKSIGNCTAWPRSMPRAAVISPTESAGMPTDPARAMDFFMPREIFAAIKGIPHPDGLHARIVRMYENDIHTLHGTVPADAEFVRFEFSGRRSWVVLREETNRLPYWAQRHNHIVYRSGGQEHRILVRTMIAWDERWYITHLSDFTRVGP